ncbi:enolase C-terminal domain-like protein [Rubrimonas sp.]|uniref:enolase C-terminal domain-like protein n=1 Tax=Rubrimonas sp. TaxID=2036015 RepID=UPI002FDEF09F
MTPRLIDRFLYVEIETSAGLTGTGECGAWGHLEAAAAAVAKFGDYLVGRDPGPIEHHWQLMHRFGHFRGAAICGAISAIDIALWDIKGQALGAPIHTLLGGPIRREARVYAHVKAATGAEMLERCLILKDAGFTAIGHLNPFLDEDRSEPYWRPHAGKIDNAIRLLGDLRAALGNDVDLCVELHRRLTTAEAQTFCHEVAPLRPLFVEDPTPPQSPDALATLTERVPTPIATGERFASLFDFQPLIARQAMAYARVSVCLCGGITGARKIAALAEAFDIQIVPHNPLSPVSLAACLHLVAATPNFAIQEWPGKPDEAGRIEVPGEALVAGAPQPSDGFIAIPGGPGLGVALNSQARSSGAIARPVSMRAHRDGFVVDQ